MKNITYITCKVNQNCRTLKVVCVDETEIE